MNDYYSELALHRKNFVFIGEAGSGKTETSLNFALLLKEIGSKEIHYFDMDQTKPLMRARDSAEVLEKDGIVFHFQKQYLDSPIVAGGVIECLSDPSVHVIMDIGGGSHGSHMIGQFAQYINSSSTDVFYIINPYRPWSQTRDDINETMSRVLGSAHIDTFSLVANPNLGLETDLESILSGINKIETMFPDKKISFVVSENSFKEEISEEVKYPVLGINLNVIPEWLH